MLGMTGTEIVIFAALLQGFGALLGAVQGTLTAQAARDVPDRLLRVLRRDGELADGNLPRWAVALTAGLAVLTLLGLAGAPTVILGLVVLANTVLPILGNALFVIPAWILCNRLFERMMLPVDLAA